MCVCLSVCLSVYVCLYVLCVYVCVCVLILVAIDSRRQELSIRHKYSYYLDFLLSAIWQKDITFLVFLYQGQGVNEYEFVCMRVQHLPMGHLCD